jgi:hypothetical protein
VVIMAVDGRTNVRHEDVFPVPVPVPVPVLLPGVEPAENFDKIKAAREAGLRVWLVSILDPSAKQGRREIKVKVSVEYQPVPPNGLMAPAEFDGLQVIPYLDTSRARPRAGIAYRAAGFKEDPGG